MEKRLDRIDRENRKKTIRMEMKNIIPEREDHIIESNTFCNSILLFIILQDTIWVRQKINRMRRKFLWCGSEGGNKK